jgi:predicted ester cyclase
MPTAIEQNKELARRLGEAINARRWEMLDDIVAPDFVRHCQATPDVDVRSLEAFKVYLRQDASAFPDSRQNLEFMLGEGDLLALWITYAGTQRGPIGPFPPSGKKLQLDCAVVLRVAGGKIAEMWVTWDNLAALAQLGHLPAPPAAGK